MGWWSYRAWPRSLSGWTGAGPRSHLDVDKLGASSPEPISRMHWLARTISLQWTEIRDDYFGALRRVALPFANLFATHGWLHSGELVHNEAVENEFKRLDMRTMRLFEDRPSLRLDICFRRPQQIFASSRTDKRTGKRPLPVQTPQPHSLIPSKIGRRRLAGRPGSAAEMGAVELLKQGDAVSLQARRREGAGD